MSKTHRNYYTYPSGFTVIQVDGTVANLLLVATDGDNTFIDGIPISLSP